MKSITTWFLFIAFGFATSSVFGFEENSSYYSDGERIIAVIKEKYAEYRGRGYKLGPHQIPMHMASWLPYENLVSGQSLTISWQHDSEFFVSIGRYVNNHICKTKIGQQLCRIYFKKVNQQAGALKSTDFESTFAKHLILAISNERKLLDSWSSNYIVWLFLDVNDMTVGSLNRWIVHEMFQTIDIKNTVGGVVEATKSFPEMQLCAAVTGNLNKVIRFASSAIRSFKIEDAVMVEMLGKDHEYLRHMRKQTCEFNIQWVHTQLIEFYANMKLNAYNHLLNRVPNYCFNSTLHEALLPGYEIDFANKLFKENPGACEFLSEPDLDQIETMELDLDFLDTWFHGPRPRIGGV